jgi:hypothetical protein
MKIHDSNKKGMIKKPHPPWDKKNNFCSKHAVHNIASSSFLLFSSASNSIDHCVAVKSSLTKFYQK